MINWDKIDKRISVKKVILPIFLVILVLLLITYIAILHKHIEKNIFAKAMQDIYEKNENPVFSISKVFVCSSADAIDSTQQQNLNRLDLYQYTDIAVYLNNNKENGLTNKNTVKKIYIDNINLQLDNTEIGDASLAYTNLLKIGSREQLKKMLLSSQELKNDKIEYRIVNTNAENIGADYEKPYFYADCSNPITLKYINKINKNYSISKDSSVTFDGSILKKAGIKIEDIDARVTFRINLINNEDEYYSVNLGFNLPLSDIYNGTSIKSATTTGREYNFFTI